MLIHIRDADLRRFQAEITGRLPHDQVVWADPSDEAGSLQGVDVFIGPKFSRADAGSADVLRLVQVAGAGLDGIDLDAIPPGAACANVYRHEQSIAEYVVTASSLLRRGFLAQDAALRQGRWLRPSGSNALPMPAGLQSAHVGFVGFGHIGRRCWQLFRAFGTSAGRAVSGSGPAGREADGLEWWGDLGRLDELFGASDVVVVSLPNVPETRGLVGTRQLELLGPSGVLVNVGRGPVVDPAALHAALSSRAIAAAAIDVWYRYPSGGGTTFPAEQDFGGLDNILMTPHVSGVSVGTYGARIDDIIENIARVRAGQPVLNRVK